MMGLKKKKKNLNKKNGGSTSTHVHTHTRSDLFIPTVPNYRKARTSHQHRRAYAVISWMRCDFYDGGVKAVTLPASCIQPVCKCVCALARVSVGCAVSRSVKGMEEGMIGDDIISLTSPHAASLTGWKKNQRQKLSHHLRGSKMPI